MLNNLSIKQRLIYYIILAVLSIVAPYLLTIICIIITQDRYEGMHLAVIPGILLIHLVFGFLYLQGQLLLKSLLTIAYVVLAFMIVWLIMKNNIIHTNWDLYQFWDLAMPILFLDLFCLKFINK